MKLFRITLMLVALSILSCKKEQNVDKNGAYVPTDVLVKIKGDYTVDKVFDFINSLDHEVEQIHSQVYTSELHADSLQYVLDYLQAKTYTNDGNGSLVYGRLDNQTNGIKIFPTLFDMNNSSYQADWLSAMQILKLKEETSSETAGCTIFFHVPAGQEKEWVKNFEEYDFVEWAELNYIIELD
ncbi:hypothetical protein DNU06_15895 [Putridiphycobacter roseus]|uniref:Lipoprotein n=1 Tax=Putridiphycobacter roseus TaxID=2219161 RepID=A0A2W1NJS0_9FLAO|nr:hypothetical protein [Putridiphycobacter roseus]PZE15862.1 hypothetical protein DNU06_15895 [Putridiphycobacter roseus]